MMKKVMFVIFIAIYPLCYEANEFQEVRLPAFNSNLRNENKRDVFSILDTRPLHIVFEDIFALSIQCWHPNKGLTFTRHKENLFGNTTTSIIMIDEVTSDMSANWKCNLAGVNDDKIVYSFEIRIKKEVSASIDGNTLHYTLTNESVLEYDGINEYLCEEGTIIHLNCHNLYKDGSLFLRYYNATGDKIIETDYVDKEKDAEDKLIFRALMRPGANRSYVECTYLTHADRSNHQQKYTYRTIFIIRKDSVKNDYFTITINGMKLTSKPYKVNGIDIYDYNFIYGENLTITCEKKDKDIPAEILVGTESNPTMTQDGRYIDIKDIEKTPSIYKVLVETAYLNQARIQFSLFHSDSNQYLCAMINFHARSFGGPAVIGLPASDMLYEYSKNNKEWIAHYQYTPNETLLLTCITIQNETLRWLKDNKTVDMTKGRNNRVGIKYIRDMFILDQNDITCQLVDREEESWKLVFHRKPDLSPMDRYENNNASDVPQKLFVIIGSAVVVLLVILITAIYAFYWKRGHKITTKRDEPATNFNENENPISDIVNHGPNGEYTYTTNEYNYIKSDDSAINVNSLYCRYIPNNKNYKRDTKYSDRTENHYTEIDDYTRNNTDSLIYSNNVNYDTNKY